VDWIAILRGKIVGLDTTLLIYFVEEHSTYQEMIRPFFDLPSLPGLDVLVLDELGAKPQKAG